MPILRQQIGEFVATQNNHTIRKQRGRQYHVAGVPNVLYNDASLRCGIPANPVWIDTWDDEVNGYDFDAYLTPESAQWLQSQMDDLGHPQQPVIEEFITVDANLIPLWYKQLVYRSREYKRQGHQPLLALAPRPEGGYNKEFLREFSSGLSL